MCVRMLILVVWMINTCAVMLMLTCARKILLFSTPRFLVVVFDMTLWDITIWQAMNGNIYN